MVIFVTGDGSRAWKKSNSQRKGVDIIGVKKISADDFEDATVEVFIFFLAVWVSVRPGF